MVDTLKDEPGRLAAVRRLNMLDTPPEEPFDHITALASQLLDTPVAAVSLITSDRQWFKSEAGSALCQTARDASFCSHAITQRDVFVVEDARRDPRFAANPLVIGSPHIVAYAGAPLVLADGYQAGALCVIDFVPRHFGLAQCEVLSRLAACVVREMDLRREAVEDDLTGFLRRGPFFRRVEATLADARAAGAPATLAVMDLDRFKWVNDTFGHGAGDSVLTAVAEICREEVGASAALGRLGGEEFGLCLPQTAVDEARLRLERLRAAIAREKLDAVAGRPVTASFGLAPLDPSVDGVATWYKMADQGLYAAKQRGRNRIALCEAAARLSGPPATLPFLDLSPVRLPDALPAPFESSGRG